MIGLATLMVAGCSSSSASKAPSPGSTPAPGTTSGSASAAPSRSPSLKPVATTKVAPPTPGSIYSTVPTRIVRTLAPVPLASTASFTSTVSARLATIGRVTAQAHLKGEIGGAAVSITVAFRNASRKPVSTAGVVVNVADAHGDPLSMLQTSTHAIASTLAAGRSASGVYVFHLPADFANPATISVNYSTAAPVVLFRGTI